MPGFDLEDRTLRFSKDILRLIKKLPVNIPNEVLIKQFIRSGTSIGANYREANETDMKKDFANKIRIVKKETKETIYWIELIKENNPCFLSEINLVGNECLQLMKIFSAIFEKSK